MLHLRSSLTIKRWSNLYVVSPIILNNRRKVSKKSKSFSAGKSFKIEPLPKSVQHYQTLLKRRRLPCTKWNPQPNTNMPKPSVEKFLESVDMANASRLSRDNEKKPMYSDVDLSSFRSEYPFATTSANMSWFPGHMAVGITKIRKMLSMVDGVVEVHDARAPFSIRCPLIEKLVSHKPRLIVLTHADQDCISVRGRVISYYAQRGIAALYVNCKDVGDRNLHKIIPFMYDAARERMGDEGRPEVNMFVVGMPNVGKSSLMNRLRQKYRFKRKASRTGPRPGETRSVMERVLVHENPPAYIIDTPGVMIPRVKDFEAGLKLSLMGCVPDHVIGVETVADYLLFVLNKHKIFYYVEEWGLTSPVNSIEELYDGGLRRWVAEKLRKPEKNTTNEMCAAKFLKAFRTGKLGRVTIDDMDKWDAPISPPTSITPGLKKTQPISSGTLALTGYSGDDEQSRSTVVSSNLERKLAVSTHHIPYRNIRVTSPARVVNNTVSNRKKLKPMRG